MIEESIKKQADIFPVNCYNLFVYARIISILINPWSMLASSDVKFLENFSQRHYYFPSFPPIVSRFLATVIIIRCKQGPIQGKMCLI